MNKALTLAVLILSPSISFAQGSVVFQNLTGLVQRWTSVSDSSLAPVPVGGGYVQLITTMRGNPLVHPLGIYEGSSGFLPGYSSLAGFLAANPGWADQATVPMNYAPGIFSGDMVIIGNIRPGADADYVVIGWTGPYATYDAAYAADQATPNSSFLGMSGIATTGTGDPTLSPPSLPTNLKVTFQGLTLAPAVIPEPTAVLLAGLGAILLLLFRRLG